MLSSIRKQSDIPSGKISEGIYELTKDIYVSCEVKRVKGVGEPRKQHSTYTGKSRWGWADVIYSGLTKINKEFTREIKKVTNVHVSRHVLLVAVPLGMSVVEMKRINKHINRIASEVKVDIPTEAYIVQVPAWVF